MGFLLSHALKRSWNWPRTKAKRSWRLSMLRIANYYESRLGRNDGNPVYVQACLKRMQYHSEIAAGRQPNKDLLPWFGTPDGKKCNLDPRAEIAAKALWAEDKESLEIDHIYPTGDLSMFG